MHPFAHEADKLIEKVDATSTILSEVQNSVWKQEENLRKLEVITQLHYLVNIGKLTQLEYQTIMDMLASPDTESHFIAKKTIENKIADSNWTFVMTGL